MRRDDVNCFGRNGGFRRVELASRSGESGAILTDVSRRYLNIRNWIVFPWVNLWWRFAMNHRGIEYAVTMTTVPGVWKWQFRIGDEVKAGKTETRIEPLAIRRVQLRIDRELRKVQDLRLRRST
jgi:hypothetical protein